MPEPEFTSDQLDILEELIQLIHPNLAKIEMATRDERVQMAQFLVELGTGIWRIRRKIEGMKRMPKEIKEALFSLESTWASMTAGGVEIVDYLGTIPLKSEAKIVEVRDIPDLSREQVVEVIKPTIFLRGEVIQVGEVVMGRPAAATVPEPVPAPEPEPPTETELNSDESPENTDGPEADGVA